MALWHRGRAWVRLRTSLGLYYHPEYAPECLSRTCRVPGLPVDRVELAVGRLAGEGILRSGSLRVPRLASFEDLGLFHSREYLESATDPGTLGHIFAMDPKETEVDPLLHAQRRAVGGTIAAARTAARGGLWVAFNLGGGFHHAEPDRGGGFCVFNDVAVSIAHLRALGYRAPILIIDLDYHQGNGNLVGFDADPSVLVYSLDGSVWVHQKPANSESYLLPPGTNDGDYLEVLKTTLPPALERFRPGLVFYLAGNDVLAGDALGGFALTPEGVLERDVFVVRSVRAAGARLVVTLAGGYRKDAWNATASLLRFLLTGVAEVRPIPHSDLRAQFDRIARSLEPHQLRGDDQRAFTLSEAEVFSDLFERLPEPRLLGFYSASGVEYAIERYGILEKLRQRGFSDLVVTVDPTDPDRQFVRIHGSRRGPEPMLLVELVVRRRSLPPETEGLAPFEVLSVEWLLLQDPSASFSLERPPVPGQSFPGLGIAAEIQELLVQACRRLGLDGLVQRPSHYHHAVTEREFRFWDPVAEGRLAALRQVLAPLEVTEASAQLQAGAVRRGDDSVVTWEPADLVLAVSPALAARWDSPDYQRAREVACQDLLAAGLHLASSHLERRAFLNTDASSFAQVPAQASAKPGPVLREILFPSDLSTESDRAFEHARFLAEHFGANITLYHAVELARREYSRWVKGNAEEVWARLGEEARRELARRTEGLGFPFKVVVTVPAAPAAVNLSLLDFMGKTQPDLTVMATRGRTGFSSLFLGSVASEVIRNAGRPVLVVRHPEHGLILPYRRIVVATDLSSASRRAFPLGALLARSLKAEVLAVHVGTGGPAREEAVRHFLEPEFEGLPVEVGIVEAGAAWDGIVGSARAFKADLIVMSTQGRDGVSDHLLGSNAERVVRQAPCPVLVS